MSVRGIPVGRIRPAIARLADLIRDLDRGLAERLGDCAGEWLRGAELERRLKGSSIFLETVYGDPCTIELLPDGQMNGRAGFADEDCDTGRWWVEGDLWFRQWRNWAYGDAVGYYTVLDGTTIKWFNADRRLANRATLRTTAAGD
jgi:GntR family transcriptional regulator/MocR family aminotransferase